MNKLGPIIASVGFIMIFVSLIVAISAVPSNLPESDSLMISSLFEGMFDDISEPFQILPGNMVYTSYSTYISDVPLLWGIQIIDYQNGDKLSVGIKIFLVTLMEVIFNLILFYLKEYLFNNLIH